MRKATFALAEMRYSLRAFEQSRRKVRGSDTRSAVDNRRKRSRSLGASGLNWQ